MKTIETMKSDLKNAEENLKVDLIKNNPKLKKSLEEKVVELKASIKNYVPVKEAPKKEAPKKEVAKKETSKEAAKFSVGDKVQFLDKETDKTISGEIVKMELIHGKTDEFNAYVVVKGVKRKIRAHKLIKIV